MISGVESKRNSVSFSFSAPKVTIFIVLVVSVYGRNRILFVIFVFSIFGQKRAMFRPNMVYQIFTNT